MRGVKKKIRKGSITIYEGIVLWMVLGISLPSIPLQGKKVEITVEHLACGRGDKREKGHGNMGTKEPEGITSAMAVVVLCVLCALCFVVLFPTCKTWVKIPLFFTFSSWFLRLKTFEVVNVLNQEICALEYCCLAQKPFLCREKKRKCIININYGVQQKRKTAREHRSH